MKIAVFWVVALCSLVEVYQRFRGPCCLHHQGDRPETLVNFYQTTWCYNPEDSNLPVKIFFNVMVDMTSLHLGKKFLY
jgi:hypothetical protein